MITRDDMLVMLKGKRGAKPYLSFFKFIIKKLSKLFRRRVSDE